MNPRSARDAELGLVGVLSPPLVEEMLRGRPSGHPGGAIMKEPTTARP